MWNWTKVCRSNRYLRVSDLTIYARRIDCHQILFQLLATLIFSNAVWSIPAWSGLSSSAMSFNHYRTKIFWSVPQFCARVPLLGQTVVIQPTHRFVAFPSLLRHRSRYVISKKDSLIKSVPLGTDGLRFPTLRETRLCRLWTSTIASWGFSSIFRSIGGRTYETGFMSLLPHFFRLILMKLGTWV